MKGKEKMKTPDKESIFKVGEWIIIIPENIKNIKLDYVKESLINRFSTPQKIINITVNDEKKYVYHFTKIHCTRHIEGFRLATESEIKAQQIKEIFLK